MCFTTKENKEDKEKRASVCADRADLEGRPGCAVVVLFGQGRQEVRAAWTTPGRCLPGAIVRPVKAGATLQGRGQWESQEVTGSWVRQHLRAMLGTLA